MYDESALFPLDVTSAEWALAQVRVILRDTTSPERYEDAELRASLTLHAFTSDSVTYYRPHAVAANLIRSDPTRAISESIDNASETRSEPHKIAAGILTSWQRIDELIEEAAGVSPLPDRTVRICF